jgi:transcriptional regulator with XRE-family HTH domain
MTELGLALKEEREKRNISLEEIASTTKIVPRYLEALENDRFDIMPGGFFIKGIIRTYARAIGLDPDEVVAKYRAAGVFGESESKRHSFLKPSAAPAAPVFPAPAAEPLLPSEASAPPASAVETPGPELVLDEAPKPRLSAAARKRLFSWAWRSLAVIAAVAVLVTLWSNRRPKPPENRIETAAPVPSTVVTGSALPAAAGQEPGAQAPAQPEPAPPAATEPVEIPATAPAVEEVRTGITIEIAFQTETRISVTADGTLQIDGVFPPGATARAQADGILVITTGNAGGFTFSLNGMPAKPLGRSGQILNDVKITPGNIKDFLEGPAPGPAAG